MTSLRAGARNESRRMGEQHHPPTGTRPQTPPPLRWPPRTELRPTSTTPPPPGRARPPPSTPRGPRSRPGRTTRPPRVDHRATWSPSSPPSEYPSSPPSPSRPPTRWPPRSPPSTAAWCSFEVHPALPAGLSLQRVHRRHQRDPHRGRRPGHLHGPRQRQQRDRLGHAHDRGPPVDTPWSRARPAPPTPRRPGLHILRWFSPTPPSLTMVGLWGRSPRSGLTTTRRVQPRASLGPVACVASSTSHTIPVPS